MKSPFEGGPPPHLLKVLFYDVDTSMKEPRYVANLRWPPYLHEGDEITLSSSIKPGCEENWDDDVAMPLRRYEVLGVVQDFERVLGRYEYTGVNNGHVVNVHLRRIGS